MMAKTKDGIIVPLFRKITQGFQKIFIPSDHIILEDNETTLQEKINEIDDDMKKKVHITETVVNVGTDLTFYADGTYSQYNGNPPVESGYKAIRLSGHANGQVLVCTDNGWVINPRSVNVRDVSSITWKWLMIPDE